MDRFFDSVSEYYKGRVTSIFIGSFIAFWSAWHWQVFVTLFFVSEESIYTQHHLLKNEYINRYFLGLEQGILHFFLGYLVPLIFTTLYIWILPRWVFLFSYKAELRHKTDRKIEKVREERRFDQILNANQVDEIKEEVNVANRVKALAKISPERAKEQNYETDFRRFVRSEANIETLDAINSTIYEHYGNIASYENPDGKWTRSPVPSELIARADLNNLITMNDNNTVSLTEKGKYFLRQHLSHSR